MFNTARKGLRGTGTNQSILHPRIESRGCYGASQLADPILRSEENHTRHNCCLWNSSSALCKSKSDVKVHCSHKQAKPHDAYIVTRKHHLTVSQDIFATRLIFRHANGQFFLPSGFPLSPLRSQALFLDSLSVKIDKIQIVFYNLGHNLRKNPPL